MADPSAGQRPDGEPRLDLHNTNVEQRAADADQCAMIDLRTGRVCRLPAQHPDGCDFQPPEAPTQHH
jgi:hypothetical protein